MLTACDFNFGSEPDHGPDFQTEILRVEIEPNPVAPGDSVTFTCVIEDSLDESFNFVWTINTVIRTVTEKNKLTIKAPSKTGTHSGIVRPFNGKPDEKSPNREFFYEVSGN